MSEFQERQRVAARRRDRLVGYDEAGRGTEAIRRRQYSGVALRRDRAGAPDVFNILLQILDDGRSPTRRARPTVDFKMPLGS